ncbi:hypothetical protein P7C70_g8405, partial [Phenoliferia sp. Uapishka_3]
MLLPSLPLSLLLLLAPLATVASPLFYQLDNDTSLAPQSHSHSYRNKIILIRHGEKPPHSATGLSKAGKKRAQCLRKVFGKKGKHNVGLIMAESFNPNTGMRARPYQTVKPVAKDLGLKVDLSCERDDAECVRRVVKEFSKTSTKDVLICWKHSELVNLQAALGGAATTPYPDDRFDVVWIMKHQKIVSKASEKCKGIDDGRKTAGDPDLELEDDDYEVEEWGEEQQDSDSHDEDSFEEHAQLVFGRP